MPLPDALEREFEAIRYFQERAHVFIPSSVPERANFREWLCLMQHFCAPTRMLDWTSSFVVALYFAVTEEPVDRPGAVWYFNGASVQKWMDERYPDAELPANEQDIFENLDAFVDWGMHKARPKICFVHSERKSERIMAQRGVFTICEQLFADHGSLLGSALMNEDFLCKIIISPEAKRFFRQYLSKLNVSAVTLFPGIDGLGRSICETIRVERELWEETSAQEGAA